MVGVHIEPSIRPCKHVSVASIKIENHRTLTNGSIFEALMIQRNWRGFLATPGLILPDSVWSGWQDLTGTADLVPALTLKAVEIRSFGKFDASGSKAMPEHEKA